MRNFSKILAFAAISAASTVAYAGGDPYHHNHMMADGGFVFGVDAGYGYLSTPEETYPNNYTYNSTYKYSADTDAGDYVWGAHVGYDIRVKPGTVVGMELGYKDLGKTTAGYTYTTSGSTTHIFDLSRKYEQNAVDLLLTTKHFIYKGFNIFGKVGAAYVKSNIDQHASSDTTADTMVSHVPLAAIEGDNSIWRIEPEMSIGVGYTFYNHLDVHAAYTYIGGANDQPIVDVSNSSTNTSVYYPKARVYSTNMLMVGISYTF